MLAVALAVAVYRYPPPELGFVVAGGLALVGMLALALSRYDAAVAIGFLLLGVVKVEPAPSDVIFAVVIAVTVATGRFDLSRVPFAVLLALGAFITFNVLSVIEAIDPGVAAIYLSVTLFLAVLSVWLCVYVDSIRRARIVVISYLGAALFSAILGAAAYLVGFPGSDGLLFSAGDETGARVRGLFEDANVYAPFLVPIFLILLEETLQPRLIRLRRALKVACLIILLLGVALAFSRAAYANVVVGIMVLLVVMTLRRGGGARAGALLAIVVLAGGALAVTLTATGSTEFLKQRASIQRYDTSRFGAQRTGVELAEKHPLGIGPGQFELVSPVSTHSTYVRTLAEQGFVGFLTWIALATITMLLAIRNVVRGWHTYGIGSAALLAAWCGILVNSFVIDSIHWRHLWIVAGLIWASSTAGIMREYAKGQRAQKVPEGAATTGSSTLERRPLM